MTLGNRIGLTFAPLVLRIALGLLFMWHGFGKFTTTEFTGDRAARLVALGVVQATPVPGEQPLPPGRPIETSGEDVEAEPEIAPATQPPPALDEDAGADTDTAEDDQADSGTEPETDVEQTEGEPAGDDEPAPLAEAEAPVTGPVQAKALHNITLMLDGANHPYPVIMAWVAALTEAGGGALILLGLLTRVWALGLVVAMGYAFWLTILPTLSGGDPFGLAWWQNFTAAGRPNVEGLDLSQQKTFLYQIACFSMSLAVVFLGGGFLSIDRLLFGGRDDDDD